MEENQKTTAEAPKKKVRRGISNETRSTSFLKFNEKDSTRDGLFIAQIADVSVSWATIGANAGGNIGEFAGHAIPRLDVHFVSTHQKDAEKRHIHLTINPVPSNVETIPNGKSEMFVQGAFGWIKHLLEVYYLNGRLLTEAEEDALALDYVDYEMDDEGNSTYIPVETDEVIESWKKMFENAAAMLNGTWTDGTAPATGKPCYKDANGKPKNAFIKLIRYFRSKNKGWKSVGNNGDLSFPSFVGEGCIELINASDATPKILKLNPITESIVPQKEAEAKAPSMPGNIPAAMGGIPAVGAYSGNDNAFNAAGDDMPF